VAVKARPYPDGPQPALAQPEPHLAGARLEGRLGSGVLGTTWRARRADGSEVAIKRLASGGRDTSARLERLQRAAALPSPNLVELVSVFQEDRRFWVASLLDDGVPLSRLLKRGRLRRPFAVAVGMGMLSALASLHQVGLHHGDIHPGNVHVGRDGTVRLSDYGLVPSTPGQSSAARRAADVRAVGVLLCSLLGLAADSGRRRGDRSSRIAESSLGVAVRSIATFRPKLSRGHEAIHASLTLWEAAGGMATARRQAQTREQLARTVAAALGLDGDEVALTLVGVGPPAPVPPVDVLAPRLPLVEPVAAEPAPAAAPAPASAPVPAPALVPEPPPARQPGLLSGLLLLLITVLAVGVTDLSMAPRPARPAPAALRGGATHQRPAARKPATPPAAPVTAAPALPPARDGSVLSVTLQPEATACAPGAACPVRVALEIQPAPGVQLVSWTVYAIDACTGDLTPLGSAGAVVSTGWTQVIGDSYPHLPPAGAGELVAITDGAARAASRPVPVAGPAAC
jgi:protein kinase-like protein